MGEAARCGNCGGEIPADAPAGACPRCALAAALPAASADPTPDEVAAKLPGFEILGVLGRGGMGVVFKARQKALDRVVALKVLPPATAGAPGFSERFVREAKAMARLTHPNIVAVHEFGDAGGLFYLVLEYVDGLNVREAMRAGRIGPNEALAIVPQICDALQYAHDRGVVHRDIKPENILIDRDGRVRIADFGLAKLADRDTGDPSLTGASQVMGTLHYMAPEQWERPKEVDHRCDIYSLGVVFYEMLTGELPVGKFEAPSKRAAIDVRVDEVVMRSLERNRDQRWQRADEMKTQVSAISSSDAPAPAPPSVATPASVAAAAAAQAERSLRGVGVPSLVPVVVPFLVAGIAMVVAIVTPSGTFSNVLWVVALATLIAGVVKAIQRHEALRRLGIIPSVEDVVRESSKAAQKAVEAIEEPPEPRGSWLPPRAVALVTVAGVVGVALFCGGAGLDTRGMALASIAFALGMILWWQCDERKAAVRAAEDGKREPVGPPVAIEVLAASMIAIALYGFGPMILSGRDSSDADEEATPSRAKPPDDRAPWEFDAELPKDSVAKVIDRDRQGIWERWRLAQGLEGGAADDRTSGLYVGTDWARIAELPAADRAARAKEGALGLPLVDREAVGAPLSEFWISKVRFGGPQGAGTSFTSAYVTATDGERTIRFAMAHGPALGDAEHMWRFVAAPVEIE